MKNVSIAKLEVYRNEEITLIGPKKMLQDFLTYIACMAADARQYCINKELNATAAAYLKLWKQIKTEMDVQD